MNKIIIGLSQDNLPVSRLIRWFTRSKVNHAYVIYHDSAIEEYIIMEASFSGYTIVPYRQWKKKRHELVHFVCKKDLSSGLKVMANFLGAPYDFTSALGLAFRRWFGKWFRNPFKNPKKLHCSEAIAKMLNTCGYSVGDPDSVTPGDIYDFCKNNEDFKKVL